MNFQAGTPNSGSIPTTHEVVDVKFTAELSEWLESQLDVLEIQFAEFVTPASGRADLLESR